MAPGPAPTGAVTATEPVPEAVFTTLTGAPFPLAQLRGKTVLLNFWATWCPPCVAELPSLLQLARKNPGKLALVAVSQDKSAFDVIRFMKRMNLRAAQAENPDIFIVMDRNGAVAASQFAVLRLPESFAIDSRHRITRKFVGGRNWLSPEIVSYFDSLSIN